MKNLVRRVDHTMLKPEATDADIEATIAEASALGAYSVCLSPSALPREIPNGLKLTVVVGFPSGKHHSEIKAAEAALAVEQGADEIDMVIDIGAARDKRYADIEGDIRTVRKAVPKPVVLKVIVESALLEDAELIAVCQAAEAAGADFVKTSTGFHPAGGATLHAVRIMNETVGGRLGVKASGGIRTLADAKAMLKAGATRLGLSGTRAIVEEGETAEEY